MYKVEVIADSSGKWAGNGLRFKDIPSAESYARDLAGRWTLVSEWRVVRVDDDEVVSNQKVDSRAFMRIG